MYQLTQIDPGWSVGKQAAFAHQCISELIKLLSGFLHYAAGNIKSSAIMVGHSKHINTSAFSEAKTDLLPDAFGVRIHLAGILVDVLASGNEQLLCYHFFLGCELDAKTHFQFEAITTGLFGSFAVGYKRAP